MGSFPLEYDQMAYVGFFLWDISPIQIICKSYESKETYEKNEHYKILG
jgi:hypothetical protein